MAGSSTDTFEGKAQGGIGGISGAAGRVMDRSDDEGSVRTRGEELSGRLLDALYTVDPTPFA